MDYIIGAAIFFSGIITGASLYKNSIKSFIGLEFDEDE